MIKSFVNYCNCGGYASSMNGRNPEHPHMSWCAQYHEWEEWKAAQKPLPRSTCHAAFTSAFMADGFGLRQAERLADIAVRVVNGT